MASDYYCVCMLVGLESGKQQDGIATTFCSTGWEHAENVGV